MSTRISIALAMCLAGCHSREGVEAPQATVVERPEPPVAVAPVEPPLDLTRHLHMKTLGGRQFWGDVHHFSGWRIQQNIFTKHHRLLDADDYCFASGTLDACRERLERIKSQQNLPPMRGKAVIVIHGIVRSSKSFDEMTQALRQAGYLVIPFDYPSTRADIPTAANYLRHLVRSLDGVDELNFVVHSMGGLVLRSYLSIERDPRIKRMVMLGVPNLGAGMADHLRSSLLYRLVYGPAGAQLAKKGGFVNTLPTPDFEFAVIAGTRGTPRGFNPFISGDDDGTVSVADTRLPGAHDFLEVNCLHSFLMGRPEVIQHTLNFLERGRLRAEGERQPIPTR